MIDLIIKTALMEHLIDERMREHRSNGTAGEWITEALMYDKFDKFDLLELYQDYIDWHSGENPLGIDEDALLENGSVSK